MNDKIFTLYNNKFTITIPKEDWNFMCKERWFTDNPEQDLLDAEFGIYGARDAQNNEEAIIIVKNTIKALREIMYPESNSTITTTINTVAHLSDSGKILLKEM